MAGRSPANGAIERAAAMAALGRDGSGSLGAAGDVEAVAREDPDPRVRSAAIGALVRAGDGSAAASALRAACSDPAAAVRRRAAELAPAVAARAPIDALIVLLADGDVTVVDAAAWALGELGEAASSAGAVSALVTVVETHADPIAREAAVAALGAVGDSAGLPAVLAACRDKPAVRRRAVLALAPFQGPDVDAALRAARTDRDWQVRQAAEDLLDDPD